MVGQLAGAVHNPQQCFPLSHLETLSTNDAIQKMVDDGVITASASRKDRIHALSMNFMPVNTDGPDTQWQECPTK